MLQDYPDRVAVSAAPFASSLEGEVDVIVYDTFGLFLRDGAELAELYEANAKVLVFSRDLRPDLRAQAFKIGARAWISMSAHAAELVQSIELTAAGKLIREPQRELQGTAGELTAREIEVLGLIAQGLSNQDIAENLAMSGNTLKSHIRRAYKKIEVTTRSQAVSWAIAHGLNSRIAPR
ncbi:DNA-binding response regulator [Nocardioides sp. NPDC057577]|uniref:response regulator transcription factor n=1 Tax=Nocardioides sp. NPDC057577 TaxID=3346171 RepID=UPI00367225F8